MRNFAKHIMACDAKSQPSAKTEIPEAFHVIEKLRPQMATLMGRVGFRALLSRSLALASSEVPWLRAVQVKSDGALGGMEEIQAELSMDALFVGKVALLANLLGLLVAFIGENLTLRLINDVWPEVLLNDLNLVKGDKKNEQTT